MAVGIRKSLLSAAGIGVVLCAFTVPAHAASLELLMERLDRLERENHRLREEVDALKAERARPATAGAAALRTDPEFGYRILDPTTGVNRKQRLVLERRKNGTLAPDRLHVEGAVTAVADFQTSNRDDKFGYLMRHPTAKNQVGDRV